MVILLILSTIITWTVGRLVYKTDLRLYKNIYLAIGFALNLSILLYYKYSDFFLQLAGSSTRLNLLLPAGISFYTFQSLTYIMDCYRKETAPEENIFKYALFVSFFPCILSGPIERSKNFLKQIDIEKKFDTLRIKEGLFLMLWGYFLKLVIVSRLTILTDFVYSQSDLTGIPMLVAMFAYAFEIYCDFAGYSFIAIGAARILGFELMRNFRQPYLAISIADFWRRWHISLSTWFRDYLYIPLGGSRVGTVRRYANLMIVFLVSGLWHGANLTFVMWGFLYGCYQVVGIMLEKVKKRGFELCGMNRTNGVGRIISTAFTFFVVSFTWMFFRAATISEAFDVISRTFRNINLSDLFNGTIFGLGLGIFNLLVVIFAILLLIIFDVFCEKKSIEIYSMLDSVKWYFRWGIYYLLIIMIIFSCNLSTTEFLYQSF